VAFYHGMPILCTHGPKFEVCVCSTLYVASDACKFLLLTLNTDVIGGGEGSFFNLLPKKNGCSTLYVASDACVCYTEH